MSLNFLFPYLFSKLARAGGGASLGSPRSAGLQAGNGLSVGDDIFSIQMEPLLRMKDGSYY